MNGTEIISKFELKVDDQSTLSSSESLDLANEVYKAVLNYKPWEWIKKEGTGTIVNGKVTAPIDFKYFTANHEDEDGSFIEVVFVGTEYQPYKVIPFSQRNDYRYRNNSEIVYYDARQGFIVFQNTSVEGKTIIYDYIYKPSNIGLATSPVFPSDFHDIIVFGMAVKFSAMDNMPKSRSYAEEYQTEYELILEAMSYENSKLYGRSSY